VSFWPIGRCLGHNSALAVALALRPDLR